MEVLKRSCAQGPAGNTTRERSPCFFAECRASVRGKKGAALVGLARKQSSPTKGPERISLRGAADIPAEASREGDFQARGQTGHALIAPACSRPVPHKRWLKLALAGH